MCLIGLPKIQHKNIKNYCITKFYKLKKLILTEPEADRKKIITLRNSSRINYPNFIYNFINKINRDIKNWKNTTIKDKLNLKIKNI